nr:MAG TPA: hypothetical protein [Caudoviricetes sp.]
MSLKTVKEELQTLSVSFSEIASKTNTVVNQLATVSTPTVQDVIEPSVKLQYLIANNAKYIEKSNSDFRAELEIILLDYSSKVSSYIAKAYGIVQLLGDVISNATEIAFYNNIADSLGISCPLSADELKPYSNELQEFSTLCKGLAEESRKWNNDLVEGSK